MQSEIFRPKIGRPTLMQVQPLLPKECEKGAHWFGHNIRDQNTKVEELTSEPATAAQFCELEDINQDANGRVPPPELPRGRERYQGYLGPH